MIARTARKLAYAGGIRVRMYGGSWREAATKLSCEGGVGHELAHIQRSESKVWFEIKILVDAGAKAKSVSISVSLRNLMVCATWCFTLK